ncbi:MAG: polyprenyl synthetase family protein [Methylophilaceae bacterium]
MKYARILLLKIEIYSLSFENIILPIRDHINAVNDVIIQSLQSDIPIINQISSHIANGKGKKMRPILHLLISGLIGKISHINYQAASIIEFIHTATLLHDDVVDQSDKRRNVKTANAVFGNSASVLVGDFIYSRSFQMMVKIKDMQVMKILADATNKISEGEVLQLLNSHNSEITESEYYKVIEYKTAKLFEACGSIAAIINNTDKKTTEICAKIGHHFGLIFQLTDDILDYSGKADEIGKNIGNDLSEGKVTLPIIFAINAANDGQKKMISNAIKMGDINNLPDIIQIIEDNNIVSKVKVNAKYHLNEIKVLLDQLDKNPYKDIIIQLAEYSLNRKH